MLIDRFYAVNKKITGNKKAAFLRTLGGDDLAAARTAQDTYKDIVGFLNWQDLGSVIAPGVNAEEDVLHTQYQRQAFESGKGL